MKTRVQGLVRWPLKLALGAACGLSLGLAAPSVVMAQDDVQPQQGMKAQQDTGAQGSAIKQQQGGGFSGVAQQPHSQSFVVGTVKGIVQSLNFSRGMLTIDSGGTTVTLRARPMEIANLNPGDVVALRYSNFNGVLWVALGGGSQTAASEFSQFGTVSGSIASLDKAQGTITIRGRTYLAHPYQLQNVLPGQFVSLSFANVAGGDWVAGIESTSGTGGEAVK